MNFKSLILFWSLFIGSFSFSQPITRMIIDEEGKPLVGVQVKDGNGNFFTYSDQHGKYTIELGNEQSIVFELLGYKRKVVAVELLKEITVLQFDTRILGEIRVNSDRMKPVWDEMNQNVIDYEVMQDYIAVLYSYNRAHYLGISWNSGKETIHELGRLRTPSLEKDCYGNIHLLTKVNANQIWIEEGKDLTFVQQAPVGDFERILKPCVAVFDHTFFIQDFTNHNKRFLLAKKTKGEEQFVPFFEIRDHESEKAAEDLFREIIATYLSKSDTVSDVFMNDAWDGRMLSLAIDPEMIVLIGFYEKTLAKEIRAQAYPTKDGIKAFDLEFDTLSVIDRKGELISKEFFPFGGAEQILKDEITHSFYTLSLINGLYRLGRIFIDEQKVELALQLDEVPFAEVVRVHNNWLYFIGKDGAFGKLYRIKL